MKKILVFILVVIILIFAYSEYKEYQRFHPKNANIEAVQTIDVNYHNQNIVFNYYSAIEEANNYMQMQWNVNKIDVRSPENNNEETVFAVNEYGKKVAKLNYYKAILKQSKTLKTQSLTNEDIKLFETKGISVKDYNASKIKEKQKQLLLDMMPKENLFFGEKNAFIYEIQKLLVKKGYNIALDGVYEKITSEALKSFEEKNSLFPDGKIDLITLNFLLK